ncbi:MAG: hypothetical protein J6A59_02895 [Lachnospiraceae bacterium]|nr:hypothetical protein [Lachnospiraceae bacterium]
MGNRWISYIYRYKGNKKCENAGYIKVVRTSLNGDEEAKLDIGIKLHKPIEYSCRIYAIFGGCRLYYIDKFEVPSEARDTIVFKKSIPWVNEYGDQVTLSLGEMDGLFFQVDDGDTLAGLWVERDINVAHFMYSKSDELGDTEQENARNPIENIQQQNVNTQWNVFEQGNATTTQIDVERENVNVQRENTDQENTKTQWNNTEQENTRAQWNNTEQEYSTTQWNNANQDNTEKHIDQKNYIGEMNPQDFQVTNPMEKLLKTHIKLPQFIDSPFKECVKLVPQDIGLLPINNWKLGQNSFLTHGYYRYKYIMLGKVSFNSKETYVIGVPGVYTNKEKYLANMFGFSLFIPVKKADVKSGSFGYWVWEVKP